MKDDLNKLTENWIKLGRSSKSEREYAEDYYDKEIMPSLINQFVEKEKSKILEKSNVMIVSVGTSYQPIVLSISTVKPNKVLFLYTDESEKEIDKIINLTDLSPSSYEKNLVDKSNPLTIYKAIKDIYLKWNKPKSIYIDFTGGTKAMSAATAMAGVIINAELIYVSNKEYLSDFRKPKPGTEYIEPIQNPYEVFGDIDQERAFDLFEQNDYSGAREIFENLKIIVPDPQKRDYYNTLYLLSSSYEKWDAIDFNEAYKFMKKVINKIENDSKINKKIILYDKLSFLKVQLSTLESLCRLSENVKNKSVYEYLLSGDDVSQLIVAIVKNAERRKKEERYDMAALLLYRVLEMIEQRRLAICGIDTSEPNYIKSFPSEESLNKFKNKVIEIRKHVFGKFVNKNLPELISLLEGYIQLVALSDELFDKMENVKGFLKKLRYRVNIRNNSIFAHGYRKINKEEYSEFEEFVLYIFDRFCNVENINKNRLEEINTFFNPRDTDYSN
jgi:CRISPR-associated protein (TIGR02710 family)